ncbi:MAG: excinuclease ABC subunit C [Nostocales cyanobacterium]|nr:MAG: excinuclease ABC subunit C [Nostocales cyanobacterium]TAF18552.1 MAG: excinuclease ABC subunit C [Nostocales cyanobacterium]
MNIDAFISQLPHLPLKSRASLPEKSGIYYIIDDQSIIWYIGKSQNLRSRWVGKSHHRIYQLEKQRKRVFTVYYELVDKTQLDTVENQRIEYYNPQLNGTIVKTKKLRPTETLLRETLTAIASYSFILGVEPPRKDDPSFVAKCQSYSVDRRTQKSVLPLSVIHICINLTEFKIEKQRTVFTLLRNVFKKRLNYSNNWSLHPDTKRYEKYGTFLTRRLLVNGFAIEVSKVNKEVLEKIQDYDFTQIAGINMRVVNENTLNILKETCKLNEVGLAIYSLKQNYNNEEMSHFDIFDHQALQRLNPYKMDLVKLLFNEEINTDKFKNFLIEQKPKLEDNNCLSSRLVNLAAKKIYLHNLLTERGLDINKYQVNKYLEKIPTDNNYIDNNSNRIMKVYVKSFLHQLYVEATVDKAFWLLLEEYLSDFIKLSLNQNDPYLTVQLRKSLPYGKISITLNGKWKTDIPFGTKDNMSYVEVINIITQRLNSSGISKLKFSFSMS